MSEEDLELLITLDDPVDTQEEDNFNHLQPKNILEFWVRQPQKHNDAYKVTFGHGDWTCTLSRLTSAMDDSMKGMNVEVCTVTHWKNGEIVEQKQFYDLVGMQKPTWRV